nr:zinc ribbon domain-containing protein [Anaerolineae bacterium]
MPLYEYDCPGCGQSFEKRVGFSDADKRQPCPKCGNAHAKRRISLIGGMKGSSLSGGYQSTAACGPVG